MIIDQGNPAFLRLQSAYGAAVNSGFTDTGFTGSTFAIDPVTLAKFGWLNTLLGLSGLASGANIYWGNAPYTVNGLLDINGNIVPMTFAQFQALLVRLGNYSASLDAKLASLSGQILAATTQAAADAISW